MAPSWSPNCKPWRTPAGCSNWLRSMRSFKAWLDGRIWPTRAPATCWTNISATQNSWASAIRSMVNIRPMASLADGELAAGLAELERRDLTLDLPPSLESVPRIAERFPGLRIAIDHLGRLSLAAYAFDRWARDLERAALYPQVFGKLSGFITDAPTQWKAEQFRPYALHALCAFGPARLMYGSDWPSYLPTEPGKRRWRPSPNPWARRRWKTASSCWERPRSASTGWPAGRLNDAALFEATAPLWRSARAARSCTSSHATGTPQASLWCREEFR